MKKICTTFLVSLAFASTFAQLENTRWKSTIKIDGPVNVIFDFKKDTVSLYRVADSILIETMTYTHTDTSFTLMKIDGQSDCDNTTPGKYGFAIKDDKLYLKLLDDACYDRYSVIEDTKWTRWKDYPAIKIDEAVLKQYPGVYELDDAHPITITLEDGRLYAEGPNNGLPKSPFTAISETSFFLRIAGVQMDFIKDTSGNVIKLISHEEKDYELKKVK